MDLSKPSQNAWEAVGGAQAVMRVVECCGYGTHLFLGLPNGASCTKSSTHSLDSGLAQWTTNTRTSSPWGPFYRDDPVYASMPNLLLFWQPQ